jgi:hypothetical protein
VEPAAPKSAGIGGIVADISQNWLRVNQDRDDGTGRQDESDSSEGNKLILHKNLLCALKAFDDEGIGFCTTVA